MKEEYRYLVLDNINKMNKNGFKIKSLAESLIVPLQSIGYSSNLQSIIKTLQNNFKNENDLKVIYGLKKKGMFYKPLNKKPSAFEDFDSIFEEEDFEDFDFEIENKTNKEPTKKESAKIYIKERRTKKASIINIFRGKQKQDIKNAEDVILKLWEGALMFTINQLGKDDEYQKSVLELELLDKKTYKFISEYYTNKNKYKASGSIKEIAKNYNNKLNLMEEFVENSLKMLLLLLIQIIPIQYTDFFNVGMEDLYEYLNIIN